MLNVEGLGVIKVIYLLEICSCERPLISPNAPKVLTTNVIIKKRPLIHAFFVLFIRKFLLFVFLRGCPPLD